jgi:vacuolar-type H+-ATPase subunit I/STV1
MSVWPKYTLIVPFSMSLFLLLASCDDSKASQCRRLITAVNDGTSLLETNKATQVVTSLKLAQDLEVVAKNIEEKNFKDPKLQEFQTRFVKVFTTLSKNINKAGKALGAAKLTEASSSGKDKLQKTRDEIDAALKAATIAAKQSDVLAGEVNKYCSQTE